MYKRQELQIRDAMGDILEQLPLALTKEEDAFSKDLLLLMLKQYGLFLDSFQFACKNFKGNAGQTDIAKTIGFESNEEYNEIMFLREITHTINAFNEMADIVRLYSCLLYTSALTSLAVDEPLEYARLYLEGNLQMWVDAEDSLELY